MPHDLARLGLLLAYAAISVAGMVLLKGAPSLFSVKSVVGFALYLAGFGIWTGIILRVMPLSQAFPLAAGALMLGTQVAGWLLLKERVGLLQGTGALFILAGVIILGTSSPARTYGG
jgi:multidrug transporter EmrE-like cation transporter